VYARPSSKKDGKPLTFGVSGRLWRDTLIMFDKETRSLWSQLKGESVWGDMSGASLEEVPSVRTSWSEWKTLHPATLALAKPEGIESSRYQKYFDAPEKMGATGRDLQDTRLAAKTLVYGMNVGKQSMAVPLEPGVRDTVKVKLGGQTFIVVRDGEEAIAWTGSRLRWDAKGEHLIEKKGKGKWEPWTGRPVSSGSDALEPAPGFKTYWFTWSSFHPGSGVYGLAPAWLEPGKPARPQTRPKG